MRQKALIIKTARIVEIARTSQAAVETQTLTVAILARCLLQSYLHKPAAQKLFFRGFNAVIAQCQPKSTGGEVLNMI